MQYWFVDAACDEGDQMQRFMQDGIWQNGYEGKFTDRVQSMRAGDLLAIKDVFIRKYGLPFDSKGQAVSVMRIKAIGTVTHNHGDGRTVDVTWNLNSTPRDWFFYTKRSPVYRAQIEDDMRARWLVAFTFEAVPQDYAAFIAHQEWRDRFVASASAPENATELTLK